MTQEEFYKNVIIELEKVEKGFESQLKDFITTNSINKPLYTFYKTTIVNRDPIILGEWDKSTPDFILTLLITGLEIAKLKVALKNIQS